MLVSRYASFPFYNYLFLLLLKGLIKPYWIILSILFPMENDAKIRIFINKTKFPLEIIKP